MGGGRVSRFAFEAIDRGGTIVHGTLEAANRGLALYQLLSNGQTPVSLKIARAESRLFRNVQTLLGVSSFDFVSLLREMGTLLKAGLPVERALTALTSLTSETRTRLRVQQILDRVRGGEALSQAFGSCVSEAPPHIARLKAAGEASGQLPDVMERIAAGLLRSRALKTRLVSDLTYPAILIVAMVVVFWVVFHTVLPRLTPMFTQSGVAMPLPTQILLGIGSFFDAYGWVLFFLFVIGIMVFVYALKQPRTRLIFDRYILKSRLTLGVPLAFEAALLCRNLQTVLDGGLPLERALGATRDGIANRWLRNQITAVQSSVAEGHRLSQAIIEKAAVLPPLVAEFAAVGEETGRLAAMMREASDLLDHGVQTRLNRLTTLVVPVTTLIMGALVAGLMSGIVSGILAVNDIAR